MSILLGYDIAFQALNHDLDFVGCMDNTVLAVVEADIFVYPGVAVFVLWKEGTEAAPAAKVAPTELGEDGVDVFRLLHYCIIDANLVAGWEEFAYYLFLLFGIERRCHLFHDGCKLGLEGASSSAKMLSVDSQESAP